MTGIDWSDIPVTLELDVEISERAYSSAKDGTLKQRSSSCQSVLCQSFWW